MIKILQNDKGVENFLQNSISISRCSEIELKVNDWVFWKMKWHDEWKIYTCKHCVR